MKKVTALLDGKVGRYILGKQLAIWIKDWLIAAIVEKIQRRAMRWALKRITLTVRAQHLNGKEYTTVHATMDKVIAQQLYHGKPLPIAAPSTFYFHVPQRSNNT